MNYKIDWKKITQEEAQEICDILRSTFNLVSKSCQDGNLHDVAYLEVFGAYDDNFHANNK
jgi:hypothetical protein